MKLHPSLPLLAVFLTFASNHLSAAVIADFTGGNGTATPDQYVGTAGTGWSGAWGQASGISGTVISTSPLNGGGNYLSATLSAANPGITYISRTWNNSAVSYTAPITISWEFRLDSSLSVFDTANDQLGFIENGAFGPTFQISALGTASGTAAAKTWAFYNGTQNGAAFDPNRYVNTGIALTTGTVYEFSVTLNPTTRTWVGSVSDGTNSFTSAALGFRTASFSANGTVQFGSRENLVGDNLRFSLDSVSIVPEPGTSSLALFAAGVICIQFRRRNRRNMI